ncbi:hypothetical protein [Yinghuangia soli]|uniref:Uncharacterized protein n=1 Tax=Yinghuangia soli TaxID=2908204 RepID=A0AA41Q3G6_9ACTN|nr:hypothetical protein [Yinghuangia soli]MCF2530853.1 hypothetical protein [Yinghuangia soli]
MDENEVRVGAGYAGLQLAKALATASGHEDAAVRARAEGRVRDWRRVVAEVAAGRVTVGSRTPVKGLPVWVTPRVMRGGFATGEAAAGGELLGHEVAAVLRAGLADGDRRGLFAYWLSDAGLAELWALLDSGQYAVDVPEEAALLVVAWLVRAGERAAALELLEELRPFAGRLRFAPRPAYVPVSDGTSVHRQTVGEVRVALGRRGPNRAVDAMREALTVWNPFADELLAHWLETVEGGRVGVVRPAGWEARGRELLARYGRLAAEHTLCGKHRKPKENAAILRAALEVAVRGRRLDPRRYGLLQVAVDAMVARRGTPGSAEHAGLRGRQAEVAARPTWQALARVLVARLAVLPDEAAPASVDELVGPVTEEEGARTGIPAGSAIPAALARVVERALSAPAAELVERGVIPSAEVLAEVIPQLVAVATAQGYPDEALRTLMAEVHRAFARRRSLLLVNLQHQVRLEELPWVRAVEPYRRGAQAEGARKALVELGGLALEGFPGTILPNPLIQELRSLARESGLAVPFTEELAADIFMGTFSGKFLEAARCAGELLDGTLYQRYYGIDYAALRAADEPAKGVYGVRTSEAFAQMCRARVGTLKPGSWVAANGTVIEQAQILTTHNLAALVHPVGVDPQAGWPELARRAFAGVCRLVGRIEGNPRALGTIKDAAYAWRQTVFFLALCGLEEQDAVVVWCQELADRQPPHAAARLAPVLGGLRYVMAGGSLDDGAGAEAEAEAGAEAGARLFLGWSIGGHWMRLVRPAA